MKKISLEYDLKTTPKVLFPMLATPSGLSKWFADEVDETFGKFVFSWGKVDQVALLVAKKEGQFIRFHWEEEEEDVFFEFVLDQHEFTGNTLLIINDFAYPSDEEDALRLWDTQVSSLKRVMGL